MKKDLLLYAIIFLGCSIMISSMILAKSFATQAQLNGTFNGSLNMTDNSVQAPNIDIIKPYEVGILLGYDESLVIADIENGNIEGIPYTKVGGNYVFSKKALEEWIYNRVTN